MTLTLDASDLNQAAIDLTGTELTVAGGKVLRPPPRLGASMLSAFEAGIHATGATPDIFASRKATDALEHAVLRPMVMCLLHDEARNESTPLGRHSVLAKRFVAAVEANFDVPLLIRDLCRLVGVSERTLRTLCQEQLGVSPQRFLALRRLHLARRALLRSDAHSATVTEIATACGFLGTREICRNLQVLFGELPSVTLHRRTCHHDRTDILRV